MLDELAGVFICGLTANSLPETSELAYNAVEFAKHKRYPESLACFEKTLDNEPRNAVLWTKKAEVLLAMGKHEAAKAACKQALELNPRLADAFAVEGALLSAQGSHAAALTCFDKALTLQPKLSSVLIGKAKAEEALGRRLDGVRSLERFIAMAREEDKALVDEALALLKEWHAR